MGLLEASRNKLNVKAFAKLGSTITLTSESGVTYNSYGDKIKGSETTTTETFIPYNLIGSRKSYNTFGDLEEGDMDAIFKYDTVAEMGMKATFAGIDYKILQVEDYIIQGSAVAKAVRLTKIQ